MDLQELIASGYGRIEGDYAHSYNCAERILNGANEVYGLGLDENSRHLACGFGAGLFVGSTCGAVCAAAMVVGCLETKDRLNQHQTPEIKEKLPRLLQQFQAEEGSLLCSDLRPVYGEQSNCRPLLLKIAALLDRYYAQGGSQNG